MRFKAPCILTWGLHFWHPMGSKNHWQQSKVIGLWFLLTFPPTEVAHTTGNNRHAGDDAFGWNSPSWLCRLKSRSCDFWTPLYLACIEWCCVPLPGATVTRSQCDGDESKAWPTFPISILDVLWQRSRSFGRRHLNRDPSDGGSWEDHAWKNTNMCKFKPPNP